MKEILKRIQRERKSIFDPLVDHSAQSLNNIYITMVVSASNVMTMSYGGEEPAGMSIFVWYSAELRLSLL